MRSSHIEQTRLSADWILSAGRSKLTPVLTALILAGVCDHARAAEADSSKGLAVEEVVVTAERRNARLVDTPISITALSGDQLAKAGVDNLLDLGPAVPGLRMDKIGAS